MDSEKGFPPIPPSELPGPEWFRPKDSAGHSESPAEMEREFPAARDSAAESGAGTLSPNNGAVPRRADAQTEDRASAMPSVSTGKTDSAEMPTAPTNFRSMVESAGAQWLGIQQSLLGKPELVMFRDPVTGSACAIEKEQCTVDAIKLAIERKRQQFNTEEK